MKKLSIEEKAKRYDKALEKSKRLYEQGTITESLCYVFPELKESEDERIRKAILSCLKYLETECGWDDVGDCDILDAYAWLENQSKTFTKKDVDDAYLKGVCDTKQELEKQGEQNPTEDSCKNSDDVTTEEIDRTEYKKGFECGKQRVLKYPEDFGLCKKPMDKVEPKFKVGDWVVQGSNILKIRCVGDEYYCFETVGGYVDDMLVSENGIDSLYHAQRILEKTLGSVDGYQSDDGILDHKAAITAVKKLYEQKLAWSEEDALNRKWAK